MTVELEVPSHAASVQPRPHVGVANTHADVLDAWRLLYRVYRQVGFIDANPHEVHTVPQAIGDHTAVIVARHRGVAFATISAISDGPLGLPVESVYPREIEQVRKPGRKLIEIGLFGDEAWGSDSASLIMFDLMRYSFWFGLAIGATDFLCGIPPRRSRLYTRLFGFYPVGEVRSYSTVNDNPVLLMVGDVQLAMRTRRSHRAIDYFMSMPVPAQSFTDRYAFADERFRNSPISRFLGDKPVAEYRPLCAGGYGQDEVLMRA